MIKKNFSNEWRKEGSWSHFKWFSFVMHATAKNLLFTSRWKWSTGKINGNHLNFNGMCHGFDLIWTMHSPLFCWMDLLANNSLSTQHSLPQIIPHSFIFLLLYNFPPNKTEKLQPVGFEQSPNSPIDLWTIILNGKCYAYVCFSRRVAVNVEIQFFSFGFGSVCKSTHTKNDHIMSGMGHISLKKE